MKLKLYEGMFILNPALRPEETDKLITEIEGEVKKLKGEVAESRRWGKKSLAYPLRGSREGTYLLLFFRLDPSQVDSFQKKLHLNENIWRLLVLLSNERAMKETPQRLEEVGAGRDYEENY